MNAEGLIKSRIATFIVNLMLQESGYTVVSYGSDDILGRLIQAGINKESKVSRILLNMPTFIVVGKNKEPILLKVKFKGRKKSGRNIEWGYKQINEYWPNTLMMIVANEEPYFYFTEKGQPLLLERSILNVNKKTSDKFARLVEKFLLE